MMSGAGRSPASADARLIPLASGRPRSSRTRSIGVSDGGRLGCRLHRLARRMHDRRRRKALEPRQIRAMGLGDQRIVLDDQYRDHPALPGTVTVTTEP